MEFLSNKPIYIQLKEYYENLIKSNVLKEGEEMPSVRDIALAYKINPNTVQRYFSMLVEEGYLTSIPKKGFFVAKIESNKNEILKSSLEHLYSQGVTKEEIIDFLTKEENKW